MKETKKLFRTTENADAVNAKIEVLQRFGWKYVDDKYDSEKKIDYLIYERDLDDPENVGLKKIESDMDEVFKAQTFARKCADHYLNLAEKCKSHRVEKIRFVVFAIVMTVLAVFIVAFRFADLLTRVTVTIGGEPVPLDKSFSYALEDGRSFFGATVITYAFLRDAVTYVFLAIAAFVFLLFVAELIKQLIGKAVRKQEMNFYIRRWKDFMTLYKRLECWTRDKSEKGFDPYANAAFLTID